MIAKPTQTEVLSMIQDIKEIAKLRATANALEDRVKNLAEQRRPGSYIFGADVLLLDPGITPEILELSLNRTQEEKAQGGVNGVGGN